MRDCGRGGTSNAHSRRSGLMQRLRKLVFRGFFNTIAGAQAALALRQEISQSGGRWRPCLAPARRKQPLFHHFRAEQGPMSLSSKAATAAWFLGRPAFWRPRRGNSCAASSCATWTAWTAVGGEGWAAERAVSVSAALEAVGLLKHGGSFPRFRRRCLLKRSGWRSSRPYRWVALATSPDPCRGAIVECAAGD